MTKLTTLILGGINSGKSAFAESLLTSRSGTPYYIATSTILDDETAQKVQAHQSMRGQNWHTIEEPVELAHALSGIPSGSFVLIDCLTMWLNNLMFHEHDIDAYTDTMFSALDRSDLNVTFVSNEVGLGGISENVLTRKFARSQGSLNQSVAAYADRVAFIAAGLPIWLKGAP